MREDLSQQLYVESIKTIYSQNTGISSFSTIVMGFLLCYVWSEVASPAPLMYVWYASLVIVSVFTFFKIKKVKLDSCIDFKEARNRSIELCVINVVLGSLLACFFVFTDLMDDRFAYFGLLFIGASVVIGGLAMSLNTSMFLALVLPIVIVGACRYLNSVYWVEFLVGGLVCSLFARGIIKVNQQNFQASFLLRNENSELLMDVQKKKELAEKANAAKTKFLAAASHDLRQPLQSITLLLAALSRYISDDKAIEILGRARDSVGSLSELLNSLLDISKLDSGLVVKELAWFSLSHLLNEEFEFHRPKAVVKKLAFHNQVQKDIRVVSDPVLVKRVVSNLLDNAIHYTVSGSVALSAECLDDRVIIKVVDTGVGICELEQQNIFQEFYQLDNPERDRTKGLGLGLSIVQRLAKILGGKVCLHSDIDGSIFEFYIPVGSNPSLERESVSADSLFKVSEERESLDGLKVLILDDQMDVRESMELLLEGWGCLTLTAANKEEAIFRLSQNQDSKIDVILVDYRLKGSHTGIDVVGEILEVIGRHAAVFVITGDTEGKVIESIQKSGYALFHKPLDPESLFERLESVKRRI